LITLVAIAGFMLVASVWLSPREAISGISPAVGQPLPKMPLRRLVVGHTAAANDQGQRTDGDSVDCPAAAVGRVRIVHFWGTWCGPCRSELPDLAAVCDAYADRDDFQFFSVSCASFDDGSLETLSNRTAQFYRACNLDLPTYADPSLAARERILRLMQRSTMAYPLTVLVGRDGAIEATWVGIPPGGAETIQRRVDQLLNQNAPG
jgi:thiol-disulfide isomerase/thioredoxin